MSGSSVGTEQLRRDYEAAGQGHVLALAEQLDEAGQAALGSQLSRFDPHLLNALFAKATGSALVDEQGAQDMSAFPGTVHLADTPQDTQVSWRSRAFRAMADGQVAVLVLAGGQGTRLGSSAPKGLYDIGLPSGKSLFQLQAERLRRVQLLAARATGQGATLIPWYVMTSDATHADSEAFFRRHDFFGLQPQQVCFFRQGELPCFSNDGKLLMERAGALATSPNGNGGLFGALLESGALQDMKRRGVRAVHMFSVDNVLIKVADPLFVGFCLDKGADCGNKVLRKRSPDEKVGVMCVRGGRPAVVEYSDLPRSLAEKTQPAQPDRLLFEEANVAMHYFSVDFLERVARDQASLLYHPASKKIPHCDMKTGQRVEPSQPNGIKLESFVFDAFSLVPVERMAVLMVGRQGEFSPVKNAPGTPLDSPDSARADISALHRLHLTAAGATIIDSDPSSENLVEISPLVSYEGEDLEQLASGKFFTTPVHVTG